MCSHVFCIESALPLGDDGDSVMLLAYIWRVEWQNPVFTLYSPKCKTATWKGRSWGVMLLGDQCDHCRGIKQVFAALGLPMEAPMKQVRKQVGARVCQECEICGLREWGRLLFGGKTLWLFANKVDAMLHQCRTSEYSKSVGRIVLP